MAEEWSRRWPDDRKTAKIISTWEVWPRSTGHAPSLDTLGKLAQLYGCRAADLLLDWCDYRHLDEARQVRTLGIGPGDVDKAHIGSERAVMPGKYIEAQAMPRTVITVSSAGAAGSGIALSAPLIETFRRLTDTYRVMDYQTGAQSVQPQVAGHLTHMLQLTGKAPTTAIGRDLYQAVGDAAQLAGWLAIDSQHYGQAQSYCQIALAAADQAGDRGMRAYTLGVMSYIHLHAGHGQDALKLLSTASELATKGVPPAVRSWIAEAASEAHAFAGDPSAGMRALHQAERAFDGVTTGNTPAWLSFFNNEAHAARLLGRAFMRLRRPAEATTALHEALNLLPDTFVRERAGTLIDLAYVCIQKQEIEEACHVALNAEALARATASERNLRRLRELLVELMPWTGLECVRELYRKLLLDY
ncbi:hypothetical protein [Sphaerisporangium sp. NPDC051011]|uniref:hypothetical protein n=1 Tax=Sphaerisporangium sp. NPDC051011 TaxID=3155792 RepID=UPI0033C1E9EE